MVSDKGLSLAAIQRIIKKAGAERVSVSASGGLARVLEELGIEIGKEALDFAMHAGRKTVKRRDIQIAAKKVLSS